MQPRCRMEAVRDFGNQPPVSDAAGRGGVSTDSSCRGGSDPGGFLQEMTRARFNQLVEETLQRLPERFASRLRNVAIVVEDYPPTRARGERQAVGPSSPRDEDLLMGVFEGTPATQKSVWDTAAGPDRVVLYQKNIESVCESEDEIREEVRLTLLHELGHYFGMTEDQLEDV